MDGVEASDIPAFILLLIGVWIITDALLQFFDPFPDSGPQPIDADMRLGMLAILVTLSLITIGLVFVWAAWRGYTTGDPQLPLTVLLGIVGWYMSVHQFDVFSVFPNTQMALVIVGFATVIPAIITWLALTQYYQTSRSKLRLNL